MWNTQFAGPTLVLLIIIAAAFMSRKRLPIRLNAVFAGLLFTDLATMIMDYVSTQMDNAAGFFPAWVLWLVNTLFFGLFIMRSYYFFRFPGELFHSYEHTKAAKVCFGIFIAEEIFLIVGCATGWIFSIQGGQYVSGPFYEFINIQFFVWTVAAICFAIGVDVPQNIHKCGIFSALSLLLVGIILRTMLPHIVIMNLFCLFAIQIIYLLYMNPDQYNEDLTMLFNERGWDRMLTEVARHPAFSMVGFGVRDYTNLRQIRGNKPTNTVLIQIGKWLKNTYPKLAVFYLNDGIFVLSANRPFDQEAVLTGIRGRFAKPWLSESSAYYLNINEIIMKPGVHTAPNETFKGMMWDAYHELNRSEAMPLTVVDEGRMHKYERKCDVYRLLREALLNEKLEMFLQPVVNVKTGKVDGAEALCRLPDGKGGVIFPDEFLPLAKDTGNMDTLGRQMFRKACTFMRREDVRWSSIKWVNVNVAPEQFRNPNLLDEFLAILNEYHLDPAQIHLEVTEESMIDRGLLHDAMTKLHDKGFVFSMDDFGSSYSNMIRLQQNHFANVKIDRDFTWSYFDRKTALLPDIINTCHDLGIEVVVEGVETKEMADGVHSIGGDYIQGYYYSKPIPVDEFVEKYITPEN